LTATTPLSTDTSTDSCNDTSLETSLQGHKNQLLFDNLPHTLTATCIFNLESTLFDIVRLLQGVASSKKLELIVDYPTHIPNQVIGDEGKIRQILTNLVGNAIKFTHAGQVLVRVTYPSQHARSSHFKIEIADTGIGIAQDKLRQLFQLFTQQEMDVLPQILQREFQIIKQELDKIA
jgi:nitrogen-specific signal transduction histidine kinase